MINCWDALMWIANAIYEASAMVAVTVKVTSRKSFV